MAVQAQNGREVRAARSREKAKRSPDGAIPGDAASTPASSIRWGGTAFTYLDAPQRFDAPIQRARDDRPSVVTPGNSPRHVRCLRCQEMRRPCRSQRGIEFKNERAVGPIDPALQDTYANRRPSGENAGEEGEIPAGVIRRFAPVNRQQVYAVIGGRTAGLIVAPVAR